MDQHQSCLLLAKSSNELYTSLYSFMRKRFKEKQFNFRTRCSTALTIAEIVEKLRFNMSTEQFCIFLEFRKAFDTNYHDLMIGKHENYGVRGYILSWFRSYFLNHLSGNRLCSSMEHSQLSK